MKRYVSKRIIQCIIVLFGITILTFGCMFLTGDPTTLILGDTKGMSQEAIQAFRVSRGFDKPWLVQYWNYISGIFRGDFGISYYYNRPCLEIVKDAFPNTVKLAFSALALTVIIAVPLGILCAVKKNTVYDKIGMAFGLLGQSLPIFWVGMLLILLFGVQLKWLPVSGAGTWKHLIMPKVALALFSCARNARIVRSTMLDVMGQDYIRTAKAKGLGNSKVVFKHALRNALGPVITMLGIELGSLLGGSIITESLFSWPGLGKLAITALERKDIPLVQCCVILCASIFVLVNLVVDLLYVVIDPKAKLS